MLVYRGGNVAESYGKEEITKTITRTARTAEIRAAIETLTGVGMDARQCRRVIEQMDRYDSLGEAAFWALTSDRDDEDLHTLPGWPKCVCVACDCSEPATGTDDGGEEVCDACSNYTTDDDGDVHCSNCEDTEVVSDSWGRSITRIKPPEEPEEDSDGDWACYWKTVGNESRVVARYGTKESAEQAVAAKDWPKPSDSSTQYLCGYCVRELVDGEWVPAPAR